jgi:DNA-binding transcriptional LysR family regulator
VVIISAIASFMGRIGCSMPSHNEIGLYTSAWNWLIFYIIYAKMHGMLYMLFMDTLDWNDLQSFLAIAETGSLSAAARRLGLTQPTLGRRLKAMEAKAGARLLEAVPRGFVLTALGEAVLDHARMMQDAMLAVERTINGYDQRLAGVVRVTTVEVLAHYLVLPAIQTLQQANPELVIELVPATRALSLTRREADIALRLVPFEGNNLVARKVGTVQHHIYAAPSHHLAKPHIDDWQQDSPLISVLDDQEHLPQIKWFYQHFASPHCVLRSNDRMLQAEAAALGMGLACLPHIMERKMPNLMRVGANIKPVSQPIYMGVHHDMRNMPRVRVVMDAIIAACGAAHSGA